MWGCGGREWWGFGREVFGRFEIWRGDEGRKLEVLVEGGREVDGGMDAEPQTHLSIYIQASWNTDDVKMIMSPRL